MRNRTVNYLMALMSATIVLILIACGLSTALTVFAAPPAEEYIIPEEPIPVVEVEPDINEPCVFEQPDVSATEEEIIEYLRKATYLESIDELVRLVHSEAGNQDVLGKRLVIAVVLNRVESNKFPNTIHDVIYQPEQFAVVRNGSFDSAVVTAEDYEACVAEINERTNSEILYFTYHAYVPGTTPVLIHQDHNFSK